MILCRAAFQKSCQLVQLLSFFLGTSVVAQMVKCLSTMWETRVQSLGWKDPPEKEMATHSSILAWRISRPEEPGGFQSMECVTVHGVAKTLNVTEPLTPSRLIRHLRASLVQHAYFTDENLRCRKGTGQARACSRPVSASPSPCSFFPSCLT